MWEQNELVPELQKFAAVKVFDLGPGLRNTCKQGPRATAADAIRDFTQSAKWECDVVLLYLRPSLLSRPIVETIRARWKCSLVGMSLDDKAEFFDYGIYATENDNYQHWAQFFDLNLSSSLGMVECYRSLGYPIYYLPGGFHPKREFQTPPMGGDYEFKLSFLGSWKPERAAVVEELRSRNIAIALFGSGWEAGSWVNNPGSIYRRSQINLGIGFFSPHVTLTNLKGRDFECPGTGACYLTTYNWELANLYEIGKEILCYRSVEELIEMYVYYSKRRELCLRIAQAAHRRCLAEHTWERRFREVFQALGFEV